MAPEGSRQGQSREVDPGGVEARAVDGAGGVKAGAGNGVAAPVDGSEHVFPGVASVARQIIQN